MIKVCCNFITIVFIGFMFMIVNYLLLYLLRCIIIFYWFYIKLHKSKWCFSKTNSWNIFNARSIYFFLHFVYVFRPSIRLCYFIMQKNLTYNYSNCVKSTTNNHFTLAGQILKTLFAGSGSLYSSCSLGLKFIQKQMKSSTSLLSRPSLYLSRTHTTNRIL